MAFGLSLIVSEIDTALGIEANEIERALGLSMMS